MICPCCKQEMDRPDPLEIIPHIGLSVRRTAILECLAKNFGKPVPAKVVGAYVYQDDPNGGPEDLERRITAAVHSMRQQSRLSSHPFGDWFTIRTVTHGGYVMEWKQ